jgi:hypothetical protein
MSLSKISGKSAFFLKVMVPVGSIIAGELNPKVTAKNFFPFDAKI